VTLNEEEWDALRVAVNDAAVEAERRRAWAVLGYTDADVERRTHERMMDAAAGVIQPWLLDAAELLGRGDPGPTPWLVENLIVDRALTAVVGRWKTTKSYGVLDMCIAIATGRDAFGVFSVPVPGPVVFVNEESGEAALWRRLDALCRGRAIPTDELRGRLYVAANKRIKLDDEAWQAEILAEGLHLRPRLFVFDPLARGSAHSEAVRSRLPLA
jgi:AAA domain